MRQTQVQVQVRVRRRNRDDELRAAHERAFEKIGNSLSDPNRSKKIAKAVEELIDACEKYVTAR